MKKILRNLVNILVMTLFVTSCGSDGTLATRQAGSTSTGSTPTVMISPIKPSSTIPVSTGSPTARVSTTVAIPTAFTATSLPVAQSAGKAALFMTAKGERFWSLADYRVEHRSQSTIRGRGTAAPGSSIARKMRLLPGFHRECCMTRFKKGYLVWRGAVERTVLQRYVVMGRPELDRDQALSITRSQNKTADDFR